MKHGVDLSSINNWRECEASLQEPEMRLLLAMIHRAILDYCGDFYVCDDERKSFSTKYDCMKNARWWLTSDSHDPWSFLWCLGHFCEDPEAEQAKIVESLNKGQLREKADGWFSAMQQKTTKRMERKGKKCQQLKLF